MRLPLCVIAGLAAASLSNAQIGYYGARLTQQAFVDVTVRFEVPEGLPQTLLFRDVAQTLQWFGVSHTNPDVALEILRDGVVIGSNNDWGSQVGDIDLSAVFASVGAFSLAPGPTDAALLMTLESGLYTMRAFSPEGFGGVILPEIFMMPGSQGLANISIQGNASYYDPIVIGISLSQSSDLLVRGVALDTSDPEISALKYYSTLVNDNWRDSPDAGAIESASAALGLPLIGDKDSALLLHVAPGSLTLMGGGHAGTSSLQEFQIYDTRFMPSPVAVPEPSTYGLWGCAGLAVFTWRARRRIGRPV